LAKEKDCELIIGTDPDADRCGVVVKNGTEYRALTGNQIGVLLLDYLITVRKNKGILPENAAAVKSIVTTPMANRICEMNGVAVKEVFTGFKFIGEKIKEFEETGEYTFIFGFEESIGFLAGTYARDKDAVVASMLIAEMGCYYRNRGMNLVDALNALYQKYGYYKEETTSVMFDGFDATEKMHARMNGLRKDGITSIGLPVRRIRDYKMQRIQDLATGETLPTGMEQSDVLFYELDSSCNLAIRPSGTEPKMKVYVMAQGSSAEEADQNLQLIRNGILQILKDEK
ncbi:MAG: phospho-sugar mutase, partial [Eubacteriales bacterium]|nr:phospho-sugar mutase [Eubacteriales bacterium]